MRTLLLSACLIFAALTRAIAGPATDGDLRLHASVRYDALCFIGVLTGDPFYVDNYPLEYRRFAAQTTPAERTAFAKLKTIIKDEHGGLVAPQLTLWFSVLDGNGIVRLLSAVEKPDAWKAALNTHGLSSGKGLTADWKADDWREFESVRPPLSIALKFLIRVHFENIWRHEWAPAIERRIAQIESKVGNARFLDLQSRLLGFRPVAGPMTAYLVYFSKPHGIRITGPRYITAYDYPLEIILRNAVHEPMHPPFSASPALWSALAPLRRDRDFMGRLQHHDPSFGYNSFEGLVEEDCVQALDQIVEERMGVATRPGVRWREADDGLHILAAALYALMKQDGYDARGGNFQAWLTSPRIVSRLAGHVRALAEKVTGPLSAMPHKN